MRSSCLVTYSPLPHLLLHSALYLHPVVAVVSSGADSCGSIRTCSDATRHRFLHRTRAYAARDQYGRSKQPTKQYLDIVGRAYLVSIGNASSSGVDLSLKECCGWERRSAVGHDAT